MSLSNIGNLLVKQYQYEFLSILNQFDGTVDLVLEKELSSFLDQIAPINFLKSHGIGKIFYLEPEMNVGGDKRLYLIRSIGTNIKYIYRHLKYDKEQSISRKYLVIFLPSKTRLCEELMESYGLLDSLELHEWHVELIPLDSDLLSLESNYSLSNYLINGCSTLPYLVASSIFTLSRINASRRMNIHTLGERATQVLDVFDYLKSIHSHTKDQSNSNHCYITDLILVDRKIDLVSPLLTQVSYEGLLDDNFGIQYGSVTLSEKVTGQSKPIKLMLNSNDPTYSQVKGYHISFLFGFIKEQLKTLIYKYDKGRKQSTISEMKAFVGELKTLKPMEQSLVAHLCACESLKEIRSTALNQKLLSIEHALLSREQLDEKELIKFFEDLICSQSNWNDTLRLLCLYSVLGASPAKERSRTVQSIEKQFIRAHGCGHINTVVNLHNLGLLNPQDELANMFPVGISKLGLIPKFRKAESIDLSYPTDTSFVYGGAYKPLSCTIIENFLKQGNWKLASELLGLLKIEISTHLVESFRTSGSITGDQIQKKYLVYFLGGCSFSEINAIRFLGKKLQIEIGVATTCLINRNSIFNSVDDYIV